MKPDLKTIISTLHLGGYISLTGNSLKAKKYKLMDKDHRSIQYLSESTFSLLRTKDAIKRDFKLKAWKISRSGIIRLHGKNQIKKQYKNERNHIQPKG